MKRKSLNGFFSIAGKPFHPDDVVTWGWKKQILRNEANIELQKRAHEEKRGIAEDEWEYTFVVWIQLKTHELEVVCENEEIRDRRILFMNERFGSNKANACL